jgi:Exocyst complex subunit Sec15-like
MANIDIDCRELGRFAISTGVAGCNQCFAELHEIALLATHPELNKYMDNPEIRRRNFPRLSIEKFIQLLEKIVPVPAGINTANLFKYDKSNVKSFVKKLKAQGY